MPDRKVLVVNTGPLLALTAAMGDLDLLDKLYEHVVVPFCVANELWAGGPTAFGLDAFRNAAFLDVHKTPCAINPYLLHMLDPGEASVIQTAREMNVDGVCIDEAAGRRIARLFGLHVTGSLGILIRGIRLGMAIDMIQCIGNMRSHGVWISEGTAQAAMRMASAK